MVPFKNGGRYSARSSNWDEIMKKKVNVGLVGAGRWGPNVIGAVNRLGHGRVVKVADPSNQALQRLADRFPSISTSESAEHLIEDSDIDAIAVCTPVETHTSLVRAALLAGKHVFVEKPFGQDYEECSKLCNLAKEKTANSGWACISIQCFYFASQNIFVWRSWKILHLEAHRSAGYVEKRERGLGSYLALFRFLIFFSINYPVR